MQTVARSWMLGAALTVCFAQGCGSESSNSAESPSGSRLAPSGVAPSSEKSLSAAPEGNKPPVSAGAGSPAPSSARTSSGGGGAPGPAGPPSAAGTSGPAANVNAGGGMGGGAVSGSQASSAGGSAPAMAPTAGTPLQGTCPSGFVPKAGVNDGFQTGGKSRRFHLWTPSKTPEKPSPVFVALIGTVNEETVFVQAISQLSALTEEGWIVIAPVRSCQQEGRNCATTGTDGRVWEPWYDGTTPASDDPGPDVKFAIESVQCLAANFPVDAGRIYVGGVSAGGGLTNRIMTFASDFFAGGVTISGTWYAGGAAPATPKPMGHAIVIDVWGGPNDVWPVGAPIIDFGPETKASAEYYAKQSEVVLLSCSGTAGDFWPGTWTPWLARVLLSYPKGTPQSAFVMPTDKPAPEGSCVRGAFTDH